MKTKLQLGKIGLTILLLAVASGLTNCGGCVSPKKLNQYTVKFDTQIVTYTQYRYCDGHVDWEITHNLYCVSHTQCTTN